MERLKDFCIKYARVITVIIVLAIYACLTISNPFFRNFNHDEVHAWNIASNFGFIDIIKLMRSEGHTFIWFLLMKPFTGFSMYAIKWVNWIFAFSAVFFMWRFAPFKVQEKFLITFSAPFLLIYPVVARCYGIGLLLLFCVAALYKKRFEHPVWFSVLVFLAANTSLMAAIPSLALGGLFGIELIIKKKYLPLLILFLAPLSLYIQWHNPIIPFYSVNYVFSQRAKQFFLEFFRYNWCSTLAYIIYPGVLISSVLFFRRNINILIFLMLSWGGLLLFFLFVYCGFDYHFYFFYVYLIMAYWMSPQGSGRSKKFFVTFFLLISILFCFKRVSNDWLVKTYYKETAACITSGLKTGTVLYMNLFDYNVLLPYLKEMNLRDYNGGSLVSFDNFSKIYSKKVVLDYNSLYSRAVRNSYLLIKAGNAKDAGLNFSDKSRFKECGADILYKLK